VQNSWFERLVYLAVAAAWAYCITTALEPMGQGGTFSRRDLHRFLMALYIPSVLLVGCAATSRATTAGSVARWLALGGIVTGFGLAWPLVAFFIMWLLGALLGLGSGTGPVLFFAGFLALGFATILLLRAVLTPNRGAPRPQGPSPGPEGP
jgi:hypothetical protein